MFLVLILINLFYIFIIILLHSLLGLFKTGSLGALLSWVDVETLSVVGSFFSLVGSWFSVIGIFSLAVGSWLFL